MDTTIPNWPRSSIPETYEWLLSHNRKVKKVNKDIKITTEKLNNA